MSERQTPFDRAVAKAAEDFRRELAEARAEAIAKERARRKPFDPFAWFKRGE